MLFLFLFTKNKSIAQQYININIPDVQIWADKITNGDADLYGSGDWCCTFTTRIDGDYLVLDGKISFAEKAGDFTTIIGSYHHRILVEELQKCSSCEVSLEEKIGFLSGQNVGARGVQTYNGKGIIRSAKIVTDTFGNDNGKVGGRIKFNPIRFKVVCIYV